MGNDRQPDQPRETPNRSPSARRAHAEARARRRSIARFACVVACAAGLAVVDLESAHAARTFPDNSRQVKITEVDGDAIVADGDRLHLAPGVLIFTTEGSTVVRSALPASAIVRVQLDLNGDVRRIWLLADDEIATWPWWLFWKSGQPQARPGG